MSEQFGNASGTSALWFYEVNGGRVGPVPAGTIEDLLRRGTLSYDTLVWTEKFGQFWKPISETEFAAAAGVVPPLPPSHVNNTYAWLLALIPIIGALVERALGDLGLRPTSSAALLGYGAAYTVVTVIDLRQIRKSGSNTNNISLGIWFWLVPAYLFQRSRALRQSFRYLWIWIASCVAMIFILAPGILSGDTYWGFGVPPCTGTFTENMVKNIFNDMQSVRQLGIHGIDVRDEVETSSTSATRTCRGTLLASDIKNYSITYTIELREDDKIYIRLNVLP
jgi:hypothetical protein